MTKKYNVGDTIYIKDTVNNIDEHDPIGTYRGKYTGWFANKTIVDELPTAEPVKPVLPKDVADEMEEYKLKGFDLIDYFSSFNECADDVKNSSKYACDNTHEVIEARIGELADAWCNGYTVEKEKKYNLILGTDGYDCIHAIRKCYDKDGVFIDDETYEVSNLQCDLDYQFTQEEIDKYNKNFWIKNLDLNDYKVEVEE